MKMADTSSVCSDLDSGIGSCSPTSTGPNTAYIPEHKSVQTFRSTEEYLYAMKEDLAEWLNCLYNLELTVDTFLTGLDTGVLLCEHAVHVQDMAEEYRDEGGEEAPGRMYDDFGRGGLISRSSSLRKMMKIPDKAPVYNKRTAKAGTFQARDNIANFIAWCRALGIPDTLLFETEDLVSRKNEKSVVLCLLEVARQGSKFGMLVPCLIQLEQEIDAEIRGEPPPPPPPKEPEVWVQKKTCDMKSLDEMVRDLVDQCTCNVQFPVVRLAEGKYMVGEKETLIFVRILRNHVMVRVGGGWDTFGNYLNKHDPCRECKNQRILAKGNTASGTSPFSNKRRGSAPPQSLSVFKPKESPRQPEVSSSRLQKLSQSSEDILSCESGSSTPRSKSGTLKSSDLAGSLKSTRTPSFRKPTSSKSSDQICKDRFTSPASSAVRKSRESSIPASSNVRRRLSMENVNRSSSSSVSADSSPALTRKKRSGSSASIELSENYSNLQLKTDQLQSRLRELEQKKQGRGSSNSISSDFSRYQPRSTTPGPETPRQRKFSEGDMSTRLARRPTTPTGEMYRRESSMTPGSEKKECTTSGPESRIGRRSTTPARETKRSTFQASEGRRCTTPGPESRQRTTTGPDSRRCTTPGPDSRRSTTPGPESRRCTTPGPESRYSNIERRPTTPQPQRRQTSEHSKGRRAATSQPGTPLTHRRAQPMTSQESKMNRSSSFRTGKELRSNSLSYGITQESGKRNTTADQKSSVARRRTGSLNNIDLGKLSVNYDEIEDIGGNEQLYLEMEKLFVEYKEQEQAKSAVEDELDRRVREKIMPDVEKYKEKQARKMSDRDQKRDRTSSSNQPASLSTPRSEHRRASVDSLTNDTVVPKNGLRSSSAVNSQCQTSNSKINGSVSKPLEPRERASTGKTPSTAVVPPFSYSGNGGNIVNNEIGTKPPNAEEEPSPENRMKKTRSDVEQELERRIKAKLQESKKTPERNGRSRTPSHGKPTERGRTPERGRPPERVPTPERGRTAVRGTTPGQGWTPVRGTTPERGRARGTSRERTPSQGTVSERGKTQNRVKVSDRARQFDKNADIEQVCATNGNADNEEDIMSDSSPGNERVNSHERGIMNGRKSPSPHSAQSRAADSKQNKSEVTPDRTIRSKSVNPVARPNTPDPVTAKKAEAITRQRRCQTPDPFSRSRKTDTDRSRPQVRSRTPDPSFRRRLNSTGSSDRQSSGADSNTNLSSSHDSLYMLSDSSDPFRFGSMENLAKPRKDDREGAPTKIPVPVTMHKSATCADFHRSGSQMSLASTDCDDDFEVDSITKSSDFVRKHRASAPDVQRLKMQSPLITGRSTIVNKKLPSPTKENKIDGVKAVTAIHFV